MSFLDKKGHTVTTVGNPALVATTFKFGASSASFDGDGDALVVANSPDFDFGSGDFTIEGFFNRNALPSVAFGLITKRNSNAFHAPFNLEVNSTGKLVAQVSTTGTSWSATVTGSNVTSQGSFVHFALARAGGTLRLFVGGALHGSAALSGALFQSEHPVVVGATDASGAYSLNGYLDALRITKGVARYTSAFTPPATAFPEGGDDTLWANVVLLMDMEYQYRVAGIVRDAAGTPAARSVRLYHRGNGSLIGSAVSSAETGEYSILAPTTDEVQRIVLDDDTGTLYNDLIDRVIPA